MSEVADFLAQSMPLFGDVLVLIEIQLKSPIFKLCDLSPAFSDGSRVARNLRAGLRLCTLKRQHTGFARKALLQQETRIRNLLIQVCKLLFNTLGVALQTSDGVCQL